MDPLAPLTGKFLIVFSNGDIWKIVLIVICIVLGGFFAASETALSQCNRYRIAAKAELGNKNAKLVLKILEKFDNSIINILICINVTHIVSSIVATILFTSMLPEFVDAASVLSTIIMTILVFLFSEMLPKNIANMNSDRVSEMVALPIYITGIILTPISLIFRGMVIAVKKIFKVNDDENKLTEDDFQDTINDITDEGILDEEEGVIINAAVSFGDYEVVDVMTKVENIIAYQYRQQSRKEIINYLSNVKYSRIPVYEGEIDNIIGVLHVKKYLRAIQNNKNYYAFKSTLSKPLFISETLKIDELIEIFQEKRTHIAIVKSSIENKILGMVTLDDLVEKLVGDINDSPKNLGGKK